MHNPQTKVFHQSGELIVGSSEFQEPPPFMNWVTKMRFAVATAILKPPWHTNVPNLCLGAIWIPPATNRTGDQACQMKASNPGRKVSV